MRDPAGASANHRFSHWVPMQPDSSFCFTSLKRQLMLFKKATFSPLNRICKVAVRRWWWSRLPLPYDNRSSYSDASVMWKSIERLLRRRLVLPLPSLCRFLPKAFPSGMKIPFSDLPPNTSFLSSTALKLHSSIPFSSQCLQLVKCPQGPQLTWRWWQWWGYLYNILYPFVWLLISEKETVMCDWLFYILNIY